MLTDAHCHLHHRAFDADLSQVLTASRQAGVDRWVVPAMQAADWSKLLQMPPQIPGLFVCLGLHPCWSEQHQPEDLVRLESLLTTQPDVLAIGETGLDFHVARTPVQQAQQWHWLQAQVELARRFDLPLVLHARQAMEPLLQFMQKQALPAGGLVHAFSGSVQQAQAWWALGFRLGLGGALTYPRAQRLRRVATELPVDALLLETDSPDMPLQGYQGQRNEPARLPQVLQVLADLRRTPKAELIPQLASNLVATFPRIQRTH